MVTLIKTMPVELAELFTTVDGRRILLAKCKMNIELYEHTVHIPVMGSRNMKVKERSEAKLRCSDLELTREVSLDFLRSVVCYDLSVDIQRSDGVFERLTLYNITPESIDLSGDWVYALNANDVHKLFNI